MRILSALVWAATALVIASTNPVLAQSASALGRDELLMMRWEFSGGKGCPPTNLDAAAQVCNQRQDKNSRPDANIDHRCAEVRAKLAQRHRLQDETENAADRAVIERGLGEPNGKSPPLEYQDPNRRPAKISIPVLRQQRGGSQNVSVAVSNGAVWGAIHGQTTAHYKSFLDC